MSHKLLNHYEEITYNRVKVVADRCGARVFPKVRLADTVPLNKSGISNDQYSFALKAHFDFLITDADSHVLFAVEFDGPTHKSEDQARRDVMKDSIAKWFNLPLLRINANYLNRQYRSLDLLTYFVEVWFLQEAFVEAQKAGHVPWDEPLDAAFIISDGSRDYNWPFWLSIDAQARIQKLFDEKRVATPGANCWTGMDEAERIRCLAWIFLPTGEGCYVETGMRSQDFPVSESDVLQQIATVDLHHVLEQVFKGSIKPHSKKVMNVKIQYYQKSFKPWGSSIWSCPVGQWPPTKNVP